MEIFKTINSFPDYEISNFGRVKTKSRSVRFIHARTQKEHFRVTEAKLLKVYLNNRTGYKFVILYRDKKPFNRNIHRLVAEVFIINHLHLTVVNHKDGNKHNNIVENLEWCSNAYNHIHATETGLKAKGEKIGTSKLNSNMVHAIKWFLSKGLSHRELSMAFKISRPTINLIANNKSWKHVAITGEELTIKQP